MLYVAIWYVSIRPVVMRVKEELQFLCCMLQFGMSRYVMRVKEELLAVRPSPSYTYSIRTHLNMDY